MPLRSSGRYAGLAIVGLTLLLAYVWLYSITTPLDDIVEHVVCTRKDSDICVVRGLKTYSVAVKRLSNTSLDIKGKPNFPTLYFTVLVKVRAIEKPIANRIEAYCDSVLVTNSSINAGFPLVAVIGIPLDKYLQTQCDKLKLVIHLSRPLPLRQCNGDVCVNSSIIVAKIKPPSLRISSPTLVSCSLKECRYQARILVEGAVFVTPKLSLKLSAGNWEEEVEADIPPRHEEYYVFKAGDYTLSFTDDNNYTLRLIRLGLRYKTHIHACIFSTICVQLEPEELARRITPWFFEGAYAVYTGMLTTTGFYTTLFNIYPIAGVSKAKIVLVVESIEGDKARVVMTIDSKLSTGLGEMPIHTEKEILVDFIEGFKPRNSKLVGLRVFNGKPCLLYVDEELEVEDKLETRRVTEVCLDREVRWPIGFRIKVTLRSSLFYVNGNAEFKLAETNIPNLEAS